MIYEEGKEDFLEKDVWYCIVPDISFFNDYTALAGDVAVQDWYSDAVETLGRMACRCKAEMQRESRRWK